MDERENKKFRALIIYYFYYKQILAKTQIEILHLADDLIEHFFKGS